jgi:hypothetical protein
MDYEVNTRRHLVGRDDDRRTLVLETELLDLTIWLLLCKLLENALSKDLSFKIVAAASKDDFKFFVDSAKDDVQNVVLHFWWKLKKLLRLDYKPGIVHKLVREEGPDSSLNVIVV